MFKFDFGIEDDEVTVPQQEADLTQNEVQPETFANLSLAQLLDALPPLISYSPLPIPLSSRRETATLARRDLFDARFQLISEGGNDEPTTESSAPVSALNFLDVPSDIVPGVYEGGLKTWECSLDLVDYLDGLENPGNSYFSGKHILEVGCGTGMPSVYILYQLFCGSLSNASTYVHLQDYNASVLKLITFPNIILAWYMSPASAEYRASAPEECPPPDSTLPGELPITPALKSAFSGSLTSHNINLAFSSGSWESLTAHLDVKSDIVLTSETIYRTEALPALIALLRKACTNTQPLCLVAAKVLYFGVGGGISEFVRTLESKGMALRGCAGKAESVWERKLGVGRKIMRIEWA
ncbi:hypothetical protein B0H15DRAFT_837306 [Mycena belliarum]|uniref:protein-histidine N-methyltransferase n=1 Tax=Mycena belliarum TaxID=1033014 RepID=A0AAD6U7M2_9AGAR|nr:hypothetical protein B0H15DRAFT_837306 [Mycena belliae]